MRKGEYSGKQREPCFNYFHNVCRYGKHCRYAHPEICESWSEIGKCRGVNGSCEKPHPMICRSYNEHVYCNRRNCKFMHPRQRQMENPRAQQGASSRDQSRKFENGRHNNGRHNNNGNRGTYQHQQHKRPYGKFFLQHQGKGPYMRNRTYLEEEKMGLNRAIVKRMVREEMDMMRGWYQETY